jgi:hypothetical protein
MPNSVMKVDAKAHSVSGGKGLNTGFQLQPGDILTITAGPDDKWAAGKPNRYSNANGLGNPLGGKFGLYRRGEQSFLYGALVGSLDGGKTFFSVGTHLSMTVLTEGTLTLHYWDNNNADNVEFVQVIIQIYNGPVNVDLGAPGPGGGP